MSQIFTYIDHHGGQAGDSALELLTAAKKIDSSAQVTAVVCGSGSELDQVCQEMSKYYPQVWKVDKADISYPNAELLRGYLVHILPADGLVLAAHGTLSMDLMPGLSVKLDSGYVADVVDFEGLEGSTLKTIRQEFGGQAHAHVHCDVSQGAVITIRPGVFPPDESASASGEVVDKSADAGEVQAKRKYLEVLEAEMGEVDITKEDILVSIGRGIGEEENIDEAKELAEAMGGVVSCSRPVVDAKWMEKSRQVGTSGQTVKPKVYLAMGISGSFQHMGGVKGNPFIVAVNNNPKAPLFQVAEVGVVADMLEFMPELKDKVEELK
ncbi:MAG: electron transfer flavoprotein subunit alpha/FixB family protein [Desulfovermiculus sp.]|nr:electron transfer flavoprotein subunit alpha/FixB family protein [Desulfovermiculus sp.]